MPSGRVDERLMIYSVSPKRPLSDAFERLSVPCVTPLAIVA